jgi:hypothetical protein
MLSSIAVSDYILPPPTLPIAEDPQSARAQSNDLSTRHANRSAKARATLRKQNARFEQLYRDIEGQEVSPEDLEAWASAIFDCERRAAEILRPQIEQAQRSEARDRRGPETDLVRSRRRAAEDALEIARAWLELYQNLSIRMLKLASDRRVAAGESGSPVLSDADAMERYLRKIMAG